MNKRVKLVAAMLEAKDFSGDSGAKGTS